MLGVLGCEISRVEGRLSRIASEGDAARRVDERRLFVAPC